MLYICINKTIKIMYKYTIDGHLLEVIKVVFDCGLVQWYFDVDQSGNVNDHYFYKRTAKKMGIEFIKNLKDNE